MLETNSVYDLSGATFFKGANFKAGGQCTFRNALLQDRMSGASIIYPIVLVLTTAKEKHWEESIRQVSDKDLLRIPGV